MTAPSYEVLKHELRLAVKALRASGYIDVSPDGRSERISLAGQAAFIYLGLLANETDIECLLEARLKLDEDDE